MKRIALISLHTPTATNFRGASALPYHLMAFRPDDVALEVWSFNLNGCTPEQIRKSETALGIKIHIVGRPSWFRYLSPAPVRLLLPRPVLGYLPLPENVRNVIRSYLKGSDSALWIYGEDIARMAKLFPGVPVVVSGPDCEAMYYHRMLAMKGVPTSIKSIFRYALMYHRYAAMASRFPAGPKIKYHLVGDEDARFLRQLNPAADVRFISHPHYDLSEHLRQSASDKDVLKILVAGRYDVTMARAADEAFEAMKLLPDGTKQRYKITFLGKGWDDKAGMLKTAGYDVDIKGYVDDYAAEISSHHIQLTPVAVGTGTKGKVLDAFANGLLVIGTPLALENIAVENGKECVVYRDGAELAGWLNRLAQEPSTIEEIARAGKEAVLREHGREKIAREFFSLFE